MTGVQGELVPARMECFTVAGLPLPQGNLSPMPTYAGKGCPVCKRKRLLGIRLVEGKDKPAQDAFKAWRATVTAAARIALQGRPPMLGPLAVRMTFTLPRPDGHYSDGKTTAGRLLPSARPHPHVRPDGPKYQRAVEDALTDAGLWGDDGQVVEWHGAKHYLLERGPGWAPARVQDATTLCGVAGADVLPHPGVVVRVWQLS